MSGRTHAPFLRARQESVRGGGGRGVARDVARDRNIQCGKVEAFAFLYTRLDHFPFSADHQQDWKPYPVDTQSQACAAFSTIFTGPKQHTRQLSPTAPRNRKE